jgi:hypothetical protein
MFDKIFDFLERICEHVINVFTTWTFVTVSLHAAPEYKQDNKGKWQPINGLAVISVVNRKKEPVKIEDIRLIYKDGKKTPIDFLLIKGETSKTTIDGKENRIFHLNRAELLKLGRKRILSIKSVYMTDSTLQDYKYGVPNFQTRLIIKSIHKQFPVPPGMVI